MLKRHFSFSFGCNTTVLDPMPQPRDGPALVTGKIFTRRKISKLIFFYTLMALYF